MTNKMKNTNMSRYNVVKYSVISRVSKLVAKFKPESIEERKSLANKIYDLYRSLPNCTERHQLWALEQKVLEKVIF